MRIVVTLFMVVSSLALYGQSTDREVISSAGAQFEAGNWKMEWTLGEPVIKTIEGNNFIVTQGFIQSVFIISSVEEETSKGFPELKVYPNPASTYFFLEVQGEQIGELQYMLTDIRGNLVERGLITTQRREFNLDQLANTTYFLKLVLPEEGLTRTFKIQKTQ